MDRPVLTMMTRSEDRGHRSNVVVVMVKARQTLRVDSMAMTKEAEGRRSDGHHHVHTLYPRFDRVRLPSLLSSRRDFSFLSQAVLSNIGFQLTSS